MYPGNKSINRMVAIGILGGTFDPVHNGHLQMATEAKRGLGLDEVRLIPCHQPPHRGCPSLNSEQRLALLRMAAREVEGIVVDDRELKRDQTSYTVNTLLSLRQELGDAVSLVFLMGMDAFVQLTSWYQWERLRELVHIAVMARPGSPAPRAGVLAEWLARVDKPSIIREQVAGGLLLLEQTLLDISATAIRTQFMQGQPVSDVPTPVFDYIKTHGLLGCSTIE